MGILLLIVLFVFIIVIFCGGKDKGSSKTHYVVKSGSCPTCGSPCKWYIDPDTGSKFFRCDWCNDFNG